MTSCTHALAVFAHELTADHLPEPVRRQLRLHLVDALGCGWAASATEVGTLARSAAHWLGDGPCHVWGAARRHAPMAAAFANALIINGLDHDDGVEIEGKGLGHPGATLVAAALAALDAAAQPVSGARFLAALAAGFEVNNRLIHALQPSAESFAQAYGVAQHQAIGAAVVAGSLWGLDAEGLHQAMGLAATLSAVPSLHKYNWQERPLVTLKDGVAPAAQAGIQAAGLVQLGFVGSRDVLDGAQGYWRMRGSDRFDEQALLHGLGQHWFIGYGSFKRYPACRWLAAALEALEAIASRTGWPADEMAAIEVASFARLAEDFMDADPAQATDAQFSLPYTLAAVAHRLPPGPAWYAADTWARADLRATAQRVRASVDPALDARMSGADRQPGARVTVRHRDGRQATEARAQPQGSAARPLADEAIIAKACRNVAGRIADPRGWVQALLGEDCWRRPLAGSLDLLGA
ncbi:MAG: MmgE/PrpD family protein [Comamonas sp.]